MKTIVTMAMPRISHVVNVNVIVLGVYHHHSSWMMVAAMQVN